MRLYPGLKPWAIFSRPLRGLKKLRLRPLRAAVKGSWDHLGRNRQATNFDRQGRVDGGEIRRHVSQGNVFLQKRGGGAAGDVADLAAARVQHLVAVAGDTAA